MPCAGRHVRARGARQVLQRGTPCCKFQRGRSFGAWELRGRQAPERLARELRNTGQRPAHAGTACTLGEARCDHDGIGRYRLRRPWPYGAGPAGPWPMATSRRKPWIRPPCRPWGPSGARPIRTRATRWRFASARRRTTRIARAVMAWKRFPAASRRTCGASIAIASISPSRPRNWPATRRPTPTSWCRYPRQGTQWRRLYAAL